MGLTRSEKFIKQIADLHFDEIIDLPILQLVAFRDKARRLREKK